MVRSTILAAGGWEAGFQCRWLPLSCQLSVKCIFFQTLSECQELGRVMYELLLQSCICMRSWWKHVNIHALLEGMAFDQGRIWGSLVEFHALSSCTGPNQLSPGCSLIHETNYLFVPWMTQERSSHQMTSSRWWRKTYPKLMWSYGWASPSSRVHPHITSGKPENSC